MKESKGIEYTKEGVHQLENTLQDANDDLTKVLKRNF